MSTDTKVTDLIINKGLTKAELNEKYQQGLIGDNELSIVDMEENVVQVDEMPVASASNVDSIVQFSGETTENYTNGYFYKCTYSDGVYSWTQINVQPGGGGAGIEWETIVDLPATYSAGTQLACPQFIVQGGLPDGNYEFYYQVKTIANSGDYTAPFGVATYKIVVRIFHDNGQPYMVGSIAPIIDGGWMPSVNYTITDESLYGCFYEDSGNFIIWSQAFPFVSDIGDLPNTFVPECFKLSAIKNTDTGDEYIATGIEPDGQQHYFSQQYGGTLRMGLIQVHQTLPSYFNRATLNYGSWCLLSGAYITVDNGFPSWCSECDISLISSGGGKWHIIAENTPDSYKISLLEASGDLTNVQIGYNESGVTILYINTPSGTTGTVTMSVGVKGSTWTDVVISEIGQPDNFTRFIVNTVGGDISTNNYGSILQYTGVTDSNYTNGYFYKASGTQTMAPASMLCNETSGLGLTITCNDVEGFVTALASYIGWNRTDVQNVLKHQVTIWEYTQSSNRLNWNYYGDVDSNLISYFDIVGPEVPASTVIQWTTSNYVAEGIVITNPSWDRIDVQPAGATYTAGTGIDITGGVISTIAPTVIESGVSSGATGSHSIFGGTVTDEYSTVVGHSGSASGEYAVAVGAWATALGHYTTVVGAGASATYKSVAFGRLCVASGTYSTAIGFNCTASGDYSVQLGGNQSGVTNSDANTLKYSNENGNFEIVSADGTIPEARLADTTNAAQGQVLTLDANLNAVWQAGGSGGGLPSQTGNAGKFLTTDGTDASWSNIPVEITSKGSIKIASSYALPDNYANIMIGTDARIMSGDGNIAIGRYAETHNGSIHLGNTRTQGIRSIGIFGGTGSGADYAIQLGGGSGAVEFINNDANTFKVGNANGNFEIMSADGTIPADRLTHAINKCSTMPTASADNLGWIVQYTGTTDSTYTHGYIYECVSDGGNPATYSWTAVQVQAGGGGSSYTAGTGIDITNGSISVTAPTVVNAASNNVQLNICPAGGTQNTTDRSGESIVIGSNIKGGSLNDSGSIRIGNNINTSGHQYGAYGVYISSKGIDKTGGSLIINAGTEATTNNSGRTGGILIGGGYKPVIIGSQSGASNGGAYSIAIGGSTAYNAQLNSDYSVLLNAGNDSAANITEHNTFWWGNHNGVYKLFDADGTIPAARHASLPVADGTYVLKLVIASGVPTLSWVAE